MGFKCYDECRYSLPFRQFLVIPRWQRLLSAMLLYQRSKSTHGVRYETSLETVQPCLLGFFDDEACLY